jgi:hypothetical protein
MPETNSPSLAVARSGGGYDWDLSIWQMEVSLTQIFDRPLRGREFFEEIIRDNLDLGRPDRVQLIFDRVVTKKTPTVSTATSPEPHRCATRSADLRGFPAWESRLKT